MTDEYKSLKSRSTFTVTGRHERAFITCSPARRRHPIPEGAGGDSPHPQVAATLPPQHGRPGYLRTY